MRGFKCHIECSVRLVKLVVDGETDAETEMTSVPVFHGRCQTLLILDDDDEIGDLIDASIYKIAYSLFNLPATESNGRWMFSRRWK